MPHPHLQESKSIGKTIIPQNTSTTLRVPSICDGLSNIFSTSVTRASSITFHDSSSDSERSDTPTVPSDSVGVIQDLELEIKDSRKENHDLRSALEVALSANAAHLQTISEMVHAVCAKDEVNRELVQQIERLLKEKTELVNRMETAVSEMNRLADVNDEMIKSIDVRNRNNAVVEANRNQLRQQVKKLRDEKDKMCSSQRDLERQFEAKLDTEVKRKTLVRNIAKLEREKASLGAYFNALTQRNAELKQQNEELNQQNADLLEQRTIAQGEYASLLEYTRDLELQYDKLANDRAARDAEAAIVIPKPLDYSELGRANVKLLETLAALQAEKEAFAAVQLDNVVEGDASDVVQQCATRLCDVSAIGAAKEVSSSTSMSAQVEQLEAIADALAGEEKHTPSIAITACSRSTDQAGNPTSSSISVANASYYMAHAASASASSAEAETMALLRTLEQRVIMRLCAPPAEPASRFYLPFTPLAPAYQESSETESAEDNHDESGEESDILGTPPQALISLPSATEIFGPIANAPATREFRLGAAPPCHLDAYTSEWVHEEGLEEDLEAEDVFTPSPTTWCVADVDPEEVYARNREAAYESGEIF